MTTSEIAAAERHAVQNGDTPINELTNATGQRLLTADPAAYRAEQRRRLSEYWDAQRQAVIQRTERIKAEQREREQATFASTRRQIGRTFSATVPGIIGQPRGGPTRPILPTAWA